MEEPVAAARECVLGSHRKTVETVQECADRLVDGWDEDATTDGRTLATEFERELRRTDVLSTLPALLADATRAAGYDLPATPVAAPPYVTVTSVGPVARATVAAGRLVVVIRAFDVERGDPPRYVRAPRSATEALVVEFR